MTPEQRYIKNLRRRLRHIAEHIALGLPIRPPEQSAIAFARTFPRATMYIREDGDMRTIYVLTTKIGALLERQRTKYQRRYPGARIVMMRDRAAWLAARDLPIDEESA